MPMQPSAGKTVLVTGGAGFIGSHLAQSLLERGHRVVVFDNLSSGTRANLPPRAIFIEGDVRDKHGLLHVFERYRPQWVNHHAAQTSVGRSVEDPALDAETNILGTINLIELSRQYEVDSFVFASTGGAIYGEVPAGTTAGVGKCREQPQSPYGCSKMAAECYLNASGLNTRILRYANVYGPRQSAHAEGGVVAIFVSRSLAGKPMRIFGRQRADDGGCVRDYVFVQDVVRANLAAHRGELVATTLDIATGLETTTLELAQKLADVLGQVPDIEHAPPRIGDLQRSVVDPTPMQTVLGPPTSLAAGLEQTAAWFAASGVSSQH